MRKLIFNSTIVGLALVSLTMYSCKKDETPDDNGGGNEPAITLSCGDFGEDVILKNNTNAPVDYIIDCKVSINNKLTIEPGTVIEFTPDAGLWVKSAGQISAIGSTNSRIVMRGTNGVAGDWLGVMIQSSNNANIIEFTDIKDAGGDSFSSNGDLGSLIMRTDAKLTLNNSIIENGAAAAISCPYGNATIINANNTFTKCKTSARILWALVGQLSTTNSYTGNTQDIIEIKPSSIDVETTLENMGATYVFDQSRKYRVLDVAGLTIKPGVTMKFKQGAILSIESYISAKGTADEPIKFIGNSAVAGYWVGITVSNSNPLNVLDYCEIRHTGSENVHDNKKAAISMWYNHNFTVTNTIFSDCGGTCAVNRGTGVGSSVFIENGNTYNGLSLCEF